MKRPKRAKPPIGWRTPVKESLQRRDDGPSDILRGTDEIAAYLRVSAATALQYIKEYAMPCGRVPPRRGSRGQWITSRLLLDLWIVALGEAERDADRDKPDGLDI